MTLSGIGWVGVSPTITAALSEYSDTAPTIPMDELQQSSTQRIRGLLYAYYADDNTASLIYFTKDPEVNCARGERSVIEGDYPFAGCVVHLD